MMPISRTIAAFTLATLLAACSSTPIGISSKSVTLQNGARGLLIRNCPSREDCVAYARSACGGGKIQIRKEGVRMQPWIGPDSVAYALTVECSL